MNSIRMTAHLSISSDCSVPGATTLTENPAESLLKIRHLTLIHILNGSSVYNNLKGTPTMLTTRRAEIKDIPTIMHFLEEYWLHGYLLAHDQDFFNWQFVHDDKVNIWIGIDDESGILYGMQALIIYTYDEYPDIAGSIWLAIKSSNPMLSLDLQDLMWADIEPRICYSPGLRPDAIRIMEKLNYPLSKMDHYYRLADRDKYHIAVIKHKDIRKVPETGYSLRLMDSFSELKDIISERYLESLAPRKNYDYLKWRYYDHPIFSYDLWAISDSKGKDKGILITRDEHANNSSSCKIVDFYGASDILGLITPALDRLIEERGYEFIDVYSYGVPTEIYENGGLTRCETSSDNIITNFFQPYSAINSDIFMVTPSVEGSRLFRGDGDQDKPRLRPEGTQFIL